MEEKVILVNDQDEETGYAEKMEAHRKRLLHRAFSIFIFNSRGQMLLQERARIKYHSGGLWTNACCGHPRPGEELGVATHRRLFEEFGFDSTLEPVFSFIYSTPLDHDLFEHEYDHVFFGTYDGPITGPNPSEIDSWRWIDLDDLQHEVAKTPERFSVWFRIALPRVFERRAHS